jgi:peroxiredoxin
MLAAGDRAPDVSVWTAPNQRQQLSELLDEARALFVFYLFDWSST